MKKKIFSLVLISIMFTAVLTGCGGGSGYSYTESTSSTVSYDIAEGITDSEDYEYEEGEFAYYDFNTEEYNAIKENSFEYVTTTPLSTFAIDVDTGSYCNMRRMINAGYTLEDIPSGAVRTEELVNYFDYTVSDENISDGKFSVQYETGVCPWNTDNELLVMTIQANDVEIESAGNNFVFLIDTSGSMYSDDKLSLAIESYKLLASKLTANDTVSIVTYAGDADTLLDGCPGDKYKKICKVLDTIESNGGTNGSGGIKAAYECALDNFIEGGNNRVILASDGDMNLGITSQSGLVDLITEKKESGVFLTTLGFGAGNYSDANMEQIADAGNGNYFYIDCIEEAERVLVDKMMQTTVTVAKDVKLQAEFNPAMVYQYRLIGYENRVMSASDFDDDTKDGGEVGAGAQVTILYELVPASENNEAKQLKYQTTTTSTDSDELLTLSVRYKEPDEDVSSLEEYPVVETNEALSEDFMLAAGCAELAMVIHNSDYICEGSLDEAYALVKLGAGGDEMRNAFLELLLNLGADENANYSEKASTFDENMEQPTGDEVETNSKAAMDAQAESATLVLNLGTLDDTAFTSRGDMIKNYKLALEDFEYGLEPIKIGQNESGEYIAYLNYIDEDIDEVEMNDIYKAFVEKLDSYGFYAVVQVM